MRADNRANEELRPIKIEAGMQKRANGSSYIEWGGNKVLAAVYGPRELHPKHRQNPTKAVVQCRYNMAPFSVDERARPGPRRRSVEISKVIAEAFERVIFTAQFPRAAIDVFIEVLQANAGTRCAGIVAASVALADAGIQMRDLVASCSFGKVNGEIVLDLGKEEDQNGEADVPIAIMPRTGEILLLQMDGHLTSAEFDQGLAMALEGCKKVYELQKNALIGLYGD